MIHNWNKNDDIGIKSNEMGTTYEEATTIGGVDVGDVSDVAADMGGSNPVEPPYAPGGGAHRDSPVMSLW